MTPTAASYEWVYKRTQWGYICVFLCPPLFSATY